MQRISFAPVLSATLSRDSCWITSTPDFSRRFSFEPGGFDPQSLGGDCHLPGTASAARCAAAVRPLLGLLKDLHDTPALRGGQRAGLHQPDPVADATGVGLVVRLVLRRTADDLAVQSVLDAVLDGDHSGLVHLVADHETLADLAVAPRLLRLLVTHRCTPPRAPRRTRRCRAPAPASRCRCGRSPASLRAADRGSPAGPSPPGSGG